VADGLIAEGKPSVKPTTPNESTKAAGCVAIASTYCSKTTVRVIVNATTDSRTIITCRVAITSRNS